MVGPPTPRKLAVNGVLHKGFPAFPLRALHITHVTDLRCVMRRGQINLLSLYKYNYGIHFK